jgi:hypothetical protein
MTPITRSAMATLLAVVLCLTAVCTASAADRIYWGNGTGTISFAGLNDGESGTVDVSGAPISHPLGLAIDSIQQRIYWANSDGDSLASANLVGGGGRRFETGELATHGPLGTAVDPLAERLYWVDTAAKKIAFGSLDGSVSGTLPSAGATLKEPFALTVDRDAGRVYWANAAGTQPISFANLDGSGGGDLNTLGATTAVPSGIAIDRAHGRVYWIGFFGGGISFANLDGSGGGNLATGSATLRAPRGLAIDPVGGRLYWANSGNGGGLSFANLDGSGGGNLTLSGPAPVEPTFPVLLFAPRPTAPPVVSGATRPGSSLTCSAGEWAPDLLESFLYRAPQSFSFQWSRDGVDIPGATAASLTASALGNYACRVSAHNRAGDVTQASVPHAIESIAFGKQTRVSLALAAPRVQAGRVAVRIVNSNPFEVSGRVAIKTRHRGRAKQLAAKGFKVGARSRVVVKLRLPASAHKLLDGRRGGRFVLDAIVHDLEANTRTVARSILLRPAHA